MVDRRADVVNNTQTSKEITRTLGKEKGKKTGKALRDSTTKSHSTPATDTRDKSEHVYFYDTLDYQVSDPQDRHNPKYGVHWMRGFLDEEAFHKKVKEPMNVRNRDNVDVENEIVELATFDDAPAKDGLVDPYYYNTCEQLKNFEKPELVKEEMDAFIQGTLEAETKKARRRRRSTTERRFELKKANLLENSKCLICDLTTDCSKEQVLQTRCDCYKSKKDMTPSSLRFHLRCLRKKQIKSVVCKACQKNIYLSIFDEPQAFEKKTTKRD